MLTLPSLGRPPITEPPSTFLMVCPFFLIYCGLPLEPFRPENCIWNLLEVLLSVVIGYFLSEKSSLFCMLRCRSGESALRVGRFCSSCWSRSASESRAAWVWYCWSRRSVFGLYAFAAWMTFVAFS